MDEKAVEEKAFRPRRKPENENEEADEKEELEKRERYARERFAPGERDAEAVDRADGEENERGDAQDCRDDGDEIGVELEAAEQSPNDRALQKLGEDRSERHEPDKGGDSEDGDMMPAEIKKRGA